MEQALALFAGDLETAAELLALEEKLELRDAAADLDAREEVLELVDGERDAMLTDGRGLCDPDCDTAALSDAMLEAEDVGLEIAEADGCEGEATADTVVEAHTLKEGSSVGDAAALVEARMDSDAVPEAQPLLDAGCDADTVAEAQPLLDASSDAESAPLGDAAEDLEATNVSVFVGMEGSGVSLAPAVSDDDAEDVAGAEALIVADGQGDIEDDGVPAPWECDGKEVGDSVRDERLDALPPGAEMDTEAVVLALRLADSETEGDELADRDGLEALAADVRERVRERIADALGMVESVGGSETEGDAEPPAGLADTHSVALVDAHALTEPLPCGGEAEPLKEAEGDAAAETLADREDTSEGEAPEDGDAHDPLAEPDPEGDNERSGLRELEGDVAGVCDGGRGDAVAHSDAAALDDAWTERDVETEAALLALFAGLRDGDALGAPLRESLLLGREDAVSRLGELERELNAEADTEALALSLMLAAEDLEDECDELALLQTDPECVPERVAPLLRDAATDRDGRGVADAQVLALGDAVGAAGEGVWVADSTSDREGVPEGEIELDGERESEGEPDAVSEAVDSSERDCCTVVVGDVDTDADAPGEPDAAVLPEPGAAEKVMGDADDECEGGADAHALALSMSDALAVALAEGNTEGESEREGGVLPVSVSDTVTLGVAMDEPLAADALTIALGEPDALACSLKVAQSDAAGEVVALADRVDDWLGQNVTTDVDVGTTLGVLVTLAVKDGTTDALALDDSDALFDDDAQGVGSAELDAVTLTVPVGKPDALNDIDAQALGDALLLAQLEGLGIAEKEYAPDTLPDSEDEAEGDKIAERDGATVTVGCELAESESDCVGDAVGLWVTDGDGEEENDGDNDGDGEGLRDETVLNEGEGVLETETLSVVQPELLGDNDCVCEPVALCDWDSSAVGLSVVVCDWVGELLSDGDSDALALPHDEPLVERAPVALAHADTDTEAVALCVSDTLEVEE